MTQKTMFRDTKSVAQAMLAAFVFPWVFDVKAKAGFEISWLIYVQLASFLFSTIVFGLSLYIFRIRVRLGLLAGNAFNVAVIALFVVVSMFSGFVEHNDTFKVFANEIPAVLFIYAIVMVSILAQAGVALETVLEIVVVAAVTAILIRMPIIAALFGIDFNTVRFQILSGATPVGTAFILSRLPAGFRIRDLAFALVQFTIVMISVTRTQILVIAGMMAAIAPFILNRLVRPRAIVGVGLALSVLVVSIYCLGEILPGNPIDRWISRTASYQTGDVDDSGLDRESQALFQLEKLTTGDIEKYIGFGIAAPGGNDPSLAAYIIARDGRAPYVPVGFADETYMSLIFLGGLIGGGPILFAQFIWFWNSIRAIPFVLKMRPSRTAWVIVAPLAVIGIQITNILNSSFLDRSQSVFFGLCLGATGWISALRHQRMQGVQLYGKEVPAPQ